MTDPELIQFAREFREGILGNRPSTGMCAAVCWPLVALLRVSGVPCDSREGTWEDERSTGNHVWIMLEDGRALDPTADQFNQFGYSDLPDVYLGFPLPMHQTDFSDLAKGRR